MLFKMLGIQRIWQQYPDMGSKPRQVFVTQSRVLATKVEEYFEKLMSSLKSGAYSPEELRMIEEDVEQEGDLVNQEDNKQWRPDLPEKFSDLLDEHFPLFITYDRVRTSLSPRHSTSPFREQLCTMLQNDIGRSDHDSFITPEARVLGEEATSPTSPSFSRNPGSRSGSEIQSSSDYMQQSRRNFVSYDVFLSSYWDRLPQTLTRALGEKQLFIYDSL